MSSASESKKTCSFSQSNLQRFIANYLDRFAWASILILIVYTVFKIGYLSTYGIITVIILCAMVYIYGKIQQKFAYKMLVDFESRIVRLHMHRSNAVIEVGFDDIESIRANGYVIFVFKKRKIFYNDLKNDDLFICLNKIMKIQWGPLCVLWGPSKDIRDALR